MHSVFRRVQRLLSPYSIHQHYPALHALRVALGYLVTVALSVVFKVPDGAWMSVTLLIVMGSLPHLGSVYQKARQRGIGTVGGALAGIVAIYLYGRSPLACYLWMGACAAASGYLAIGKLGYIALIAGVTLTIVAGHGDNSFETALWRALNVQLGGMIALMFARLLPQRAVNHWKYLLADNLRDCAALYGRIAVLDLPDEATVQETFDRLNKRLIAQRGLMSAVAGEVSLTVAELDRIQRTQRNMLGLLELMVEVCRNPSRHAEFASMRKQVEHNQRRAQALMRTTAHALKFDRLDRLTRIGYAPQAEVTALPAGASDAGFEAVGYVWLNIKLLRQVERINAALLETASAWYRPPVRA